MKLILDEISCSVALQVYHQGVKLENALPPGTFSMNHNGALEVADASFHLVGTLFSFQEQSWTVISNDVGLNMVQVESISGERRTFRYDFVMDLC